MVYIIFSFGCGLFIWAWYNIFIRVWSFHSGMVFSFGYGIVFVIIQSVYQHTCNTRSEHVIIGQHHVNQIIADACTFCPWGFAYIFAELDWH